MLLDWITVQGRLLHHAPLGVGNYGKAIEGGEKYAGAWETFRNVREQWESGGNHVKWIAFNAIAL